MSSEQTSPCRGYSLNGEVGDVDICTTSANSPLGTLTKLPREVRDQIYYFSLTNEHRYTICKFSWCYTLARPQWSGSRIFSALLQASSSIRREALQVLATYVLFDFGDVSDCRRLRQCDIPLLQYIQNIRFSIPMRNMERLGNVASDPLSVCPLAFFTGDNPLRGYCKITINMQTVEALSKVLDSHFGTAVFESLGFRIVELEFVIYKFDYSGKEDCESALTDINSVLNDALEPYIGRIRMQTKVYGGPHQARKKVRFHPRAHSSTKAAKDQSQYQQEWMGVTATGIHSGRWITWGKDDAAV
ncbi:hypothetical protein ACLMJK_001462 [Lecanora helva]